MELNTSQRAPDACASGTSDLGALTHRTNMIFMMRRCHPPEERTPPIAPASVSSRGDRATSKRNLLGSARRKSSSRRSVRWRKQFGDLELGRSGTASLSASTLIEGELTPKRVRPNCLNHGPADVGRLVLLLQTAGRLAPSRRHLERLITNSQVWPNRGSDRHKLAARFGADHATLRADDIHPAEETASWPLKRARQNSAR